MESKNLEDTYEQNRSSVENIAGLHETANVPLLHSDCSSCKVCQLQDFNGRQKPPRHIFRRIAIDIFFVLALTLLLSISIWWSTWDVLNNRRSIALPEIDIAYQHRAYRLMHTSPFIGTDFGKSDAAWEKLIGSTNLRVTSEELSRQASGYDSIELPNGGHLAWLGVFHELHCIRLLRKMNYREHYFPNMTLTQLENHQTHVDHCIDQLREASICRADTESLTAFTWESGYPKPLLSQKRPQHQCVDWQALTDSLRSRVVSLEEIHEARRPVRL